MPAEAKKYVTAMLKATYRDGMEELLDYMNICGFFTAPCSSQFHLACKTGLAEHTANVMRLAEKMGVALLGGAEYNKIHKSLMIAAGLHDLGKMGQFEKPLYVEKRLKDGSIGKIPYEQNKELLPVDHEIRSIAIASMFIDLTEEEQFAILYHNGLYGTIGKYSLQGKETVLYMLLHWADLWASRVVEVNHEH